MAKEPTPQEFVKEVREVVGDKTRYVSIFFRTSPFWARVEIHKYGKIAVFEGRTLRSCLTKLKKEVGSG